jgi:polysaccharide pyruvyl transferase CsaB
VKEKILICGNYGVGNLGDEAILRALIQKWEETFEITVMSANPEKTEAKFNVKAIHKYPSGIRTHFQRIFTSEGRKRGKETVKAMRNSDRFILGGGTLLTDEPWKSMFVWGAQVKLAQKERKKIEIYSNGIGPFRKQWSRRWAKKILSKASKISVRDERSSEWVQRLIGECPTLIKDPVLGMKILNKKEVKNIDKKAAIFAIRYWTNNMNKIERTIKDFIQFLWLEKGVKSVLVPFEKGNKKDAEIVNKIIEQLPAGYGARIWDDYQDEATIINAISQSHLVVGMRLHSLIFSHITNTPFIGISYMEKVKALGEELNKKEWIIDLKNLSLEHLKEIYINHYNDGNSPNSD